MVVTPNAGFEALLAEAIEPIFAAQQAAAAMQLERARMAAALEPAIEQMATELKNTTLMAELAHQQVQSIAPVLDTLAPTIRATLHPPVLQAIAEVTEALQGATALQASVQEVTEAVQLAADLATVSSVRTTTTYGGSDVSVADAAWISIKAGNPRLPHETVLEHLDIAGLTASVASFATRGITDPQLRNFTVLIVTAMVVTYLETPKWGDVMNIITLVAVLLGVLSFFISNE